MCSQILHVLEIRCRRSWSRITGQDGKTEGTGGGGRRVDAPTLICTVRLYQSVGLPHKTPEAYAVQDAEVVRSGSDKIGVKYLLSLDRWPRHTRDTCEMAARGAADVHGRSSGRPAA